MKVAIAGLWHLGLVTAACLAKAGHVVLGYDADSLLVEKIKQKELPIFEPGLDDLVAQNEQHLSFTSSPKEISHAEVVWITYDTPVDDHDQADVEFVMEEWKKICPYLSANTLVIVSSQLPVGSTRRMQSLVIDAKQKNISFVCIPENLRLGKAIDVFTKPDRFVVGLSNPSDQERIQQLLGQFTHHFVWMSVESAEMTKHAINAFLAISVSFINELAVLCEEVGADAREVEKGLKTEERIGPKAYLRPGHAIAGGTLARDIQYLTHIAKQVNNPAYLLNAVNESNQYHKAWLFRKIKKQFTQLNGKTFALLGLTYKAGTNTLRRSFALEVCEWLHQAGCKIKAYDPAVLELPEVFKKMMTLDSVMDQVLKEVDAVIVTSDWPQFKSITADHLLLHSKSPVVFDPASIISSVCGDDPRVRYFSVGREVVCS